MGVDEAGHHDPAAASITAAPPACRLRPTAAILLPSTSTSASREVADLRVHRHHRAAADQVAAPAAAALLWFAIILGLRRGGPKECQCSGRCGDGTAGLEPVPPWVAAPPPVASRPWSCGSPRSHSLHMSAPPFEAIILCSTGRSTPDGRRFLTSTTPSSGRPAIRRVSMRCDRQCNRVAFSSRMPMIRASPPPSISPPQW